MYLDLALYNLLLMSVVPFVVYSLVVHAALHGIALYLYNTATMHQCSAIHSACTKIR
jgi:hypothetical protein